MLLLLVCDVFGEAVSERKEKKRKIEREELEEDECARAYPVYQ